MIKNETAKKLKSAGYTLTENTLIKAIDGDFYPFPTLSELMEACPDHCGLQREDFGWVLYVKGFIREETVSETSHEAVAKLWLSLNKNDKK